MLLQPLNSNSICSTAVKVLSHPVLLQSLTTLLPTTFAEDLKWFEMSYLDPHNSPDWCVQIKYIQSFLLGDHNPLYPEEGQYVNACMQIMSHHLIYFEKIYFYLQYHWQTQSDARNQTALMSVKLREKWIRCLGFSKEACLHRRGVILRKIIN